MVKLCSARPSARRSILPVATLAVTSLTVAACGNGGQNGLAAEQEIEQSLAADAPVSAAAAFFPLAWVTAEVGGDRVSVTDLTPPGSNEHGLELSPGTVDSLSRQDVIVYLADFQPAIDSAVATVGSEVLTYDVTADAQLAPIEGEHDGHGHNEEAAGEHEDHAHDLAGMDPHFWLDPQRLANVALQVAEHLAEIDPEGAQTYRANAEATANELNALAARLDEGLSQCENSTIVVTHQAYGYLTDPHGIETIGISGINPDTEPSPARIAEIERAVAGSDATTVFGEIAVDQRMAQVIAEQTGLSVDVLDPLGSQLDEASTYPEQMEQNLQALRTALACQ